MEQKSSISIVIPVYNSMFSLPILIEQLANEMPKFADSFEVILVNDGSADGSWNEIFQLSSQYDFIIGVDLAKNYGQHNALLCGIRIAKYVTIVTMDDDLQHNPKDIKLLVAQLEKGFDIVYGKPKKEQHNIYRNVSSRVTKMIFQKILGFPHLEDVHAFRAFRGELKTAFENYAGIDTFIDVLLGWGTTKITSVEVDYAPRTIGKSNYSFRKLARHAMSLIFGYSVFPLRISSILGVIIILLGGGYLVYVLVAYFTGNITEPGFTSIVSAIAVFSGVQLFSLGIFGEYMIRIYQLSISKSNYLVREVIDRNNANQA